MENQTTLSTSLTPIQQSNQQEASQVAQRKGIKNKLLTITLLLLFLTTSGVAGFFAYEKYNLKNKSTLLQNKLVPSISEPPAKTTPTINKKEDANLENEFNCGPLELSDDGIKNPYFKLNLFSGGLNNIALNWVILKGSYKKCHIALKILDKNEVLIYLTWGNKKLEEFVEEYTKYTEVYTIEELKIIDDRDITGRKIVLKRTIPGTVFKIKYELAYIFQRKNTIYVIYTENEDSIEQLDLLEKDFKAIVSHLELY